MVRSCCNVQHGSTFAFAPWIVISRATIRVSLSPPTVARRLSVSRCRWLAASFPVQTIVDFASRFLAPIRRSFRFVPPVLAVRVSRRSLSLGFILRRTPFVHSWFRRRDRNRRRRRDGDGSRRQRGNEHAGIHRAHVHTFTCRHNAPDHPEELSYKLSLIQRRSRSEDERPTGRAAVARRTTPRLAFAERLSTRPGNRTRGRR